MNEEKQIRQAMLCLEESRTMLTRDELVKRACVSEAVASAALGRLYDMGRLDFETVKASSAWGAGQGKEEVVIRYGVKEVAHAA